MTSSYSWRYALAGLGARFTCHALDLPGNGATDPVLRAPYTPGALAAFLGEVQAALGIAGCACIANSMGGYIAMHAALADARAFSRLVVVHAPGLPDLRLTALHAALAIPGARAVLLRLIARDPLRWAHRHVHYWDETLKSLEEAREYGAPLATDAGRRAFVKYLAETMHPRHARALAATLRARRRAGAPFPMPLTLIYAERDPIVPPRIGSALAALVPSARLVRVRDASHFMHVDAVERFVPIALETLGVAAPAAAPTART
jgi:pimeloyl-ACP methyl ester carboxylesterase